jgi:hypothetical protein
LPNSRIIVKLTEAEASCEYLVNNLDLADGEWAITCDIGGATVDVALAVIQTKDQMPLPGVVFPIGSNRIGVHGVSSIDYAFQEWIFNYLDDAKCGNPKEISEMLTETLWWQYTRYSYDASKEVVLLPAYYIKQYKTSSGDNNLSNGPTIQIPM